MSVFNFEFMTLLNDCCVVAVNAVAPGPILAASNQCGKSFQKSQERFPLAYNPSPRDVADAVSFLLTAKAITGQTIYVDSGDRFYCKLVDGIEVE